MRGRRRGPVPRSRRRSGTCMLEPGVSRNYAGQIHKHLMPFFGPMKMPDIMPEHVREWVTAMKAKGASARTIEYCKRSILNAIFSTAMKDEVVTIHPSHGVKIPPVPREAPPHHHRRPVRPAVPGVAGR